MYQTLAWNYLDFPCRFMGGWPWRRCSAKFAKGVRLAPSEVPDPLEIDIDPLGPQLDEMVPSLPDVFTISGLVLSQRLYQTIVDFGVDNLDVYPAVMIDSQTKQRFPHFYAVNVVGLIAAADMVKSRATVAPGGPLRDIAFDHLVIDEAKARGALMFRLAESTANVWLHPSLVEHIKAAGFPGIEFFHPGEVFG
jgi:hypothetical protein